MKKLAALLFPLILISCSSASKKSGRSDWPIPTTTAIPEGFFQLRRGDETGRAVLLELEKKCSTKPCEWQLQYLRALAQIKNPTSESCELFTRLAQETEFALNSLAEVRAHQACPVTADTYKATKSLASDSSLPRWLGRVSKDEWRRQALLQNELEEYLKLTQELVKSSNGRKTKVNLILEALPYAQKLGEKQKKDLQQLLISVAPRYNPVPTDWMATSMDAMAARDYDLAVDGFQKILRNPASPSNLKRQALEKIRQSYKISQNKSKVLAYTLKLVDFDKTELKKSPQDFSNLRNLLSSTLLLARTHWNEQRPEVAENILKKFERTYRRQVNMADIYTLLARIQEERQDWPASLALFEKALLNENGTADKASLRWRIAWIKMKMGNLDESVQEIERLRSEEEDPSKKIQQSFWIAKIKKHLKKPEAQELFQKVLEDDPVGYYGVMAYYELGIQLPKIHPLETSPSKVMRKLSPEQNSQWTQLEWLVSVGEFNLAQMALDQEMRLPDPSVEEWSEIATRYAKAGSFAALFGKIGKLSPDEKRVLLSEHSEVLFPLPYQEIVLPEAKKWEMDPSYVYSIMRQESSFNPEALSPADAYGLMQLLPSVAARVAARTNIPYSKAEDLYDPYINIPLGVAYLKELHSKYQGQFVMMTASYNASEEAVKSWVKTRFANDPVQFIEEIPYEETRTYVKLVLRNMIHYMRLQGESDDIPFPEWTLRGLASWKN